MSLTLASEQRRSYAAPLLSAAVVLSLLLGAYFFFNPHRTAELTANHTAIFAPTTTFKLPQGAVHIIGQQPQAEQNLYAVETVQVRNELRVPLYIDEIDGSYTGSDGRGQDAVAPGHADLERMQVVFPQLRTMMPHPLLMGDTIAAKATAEGQVLLHYNALTEQDWNLRKTASVSVHFAHNQGALTTTVP